VLARSAAFCDNALVINKHEEITTALPRDLDALPRLNGFRLRGVAITRLESFVDATFAFAITVLIIAGQQVPNDVETLLNAFRDVPAFAASITVLAIFWRGHWVWSRRFGLEDGTSIVISWAMIFTMLIYVYPLKVVFNGMFAALTGGFVGHGIMVRTLQQGRAVFAVYAVGFSAIAAQIALLNLRAWYLRDALQLNQRELLLTRCAIEGWSIPVAVGIVSLLLALVLPRGYLGWSGWVYYSLALLLALHRRSVRARLRDLNTRL
jgi:uncharacterized membrane protein